LRLTGHVARIGDRRVAYRILVGITEGRRTLGRRRQREENSNKIKFKEIGWGGTDWIYLA